VFSVVNRKRLEYFLGVISFSLPISNALSFQLANVDQNFYSYYWVILGIYLMVVINTVLFTKVEWHKNMRFYITSDVLKYIILNVVLDLIYAILIEKSTVHAIYSVLYDTLAAIIVFFLNYNIRRSEWGLFRLLILVQLLNNLVDTCFYALSFYHFVIEITGLPIRLDLFKFFLTATDSIVDLLVSWALFQFAFHKLWDMRSDTFMRPKIILSGMPGSFNGNLEYESIESEDTM